MIEFIGVSKSFDGFKALSDINVKLPSNSFVSLLGPNGAEKPLCCDCLRDLYNPTGDRLSWTAVKFPMTGAH